MVALYEPYDRTKPERRDDFPYRVEMRPFRDMRRLWLMKNWLDSDHGRGNYTYYVVRGDHIDRGPYEARIFAFDDSTTAFTFGEEFQDDRW